MTKSRTDQYWMRKALSAARKGWGKTSPNPMVGAIVVKDGEAIGTGWHKQAGGPHAEPEALRAAGMAARGADLYVTLEPCSSHGRTPPCTEAIITAGIRRCIWAVDDPDPRHRGTAAAQLAANGIETATGILKQEAADLNRAFFCHARHGRPWVILKMAMTLDGRIATKEGASQWITGPAARKHVQRLRQWADAVLVGAETVRCDDPSLLVRSPKRWKHQPIRLIGGRMPIDDLLLHSGARPKMLSDNATPVRQFECTSPEIIRKQLQQLGEKQTKALLVEGGGELAGRLLQAGCVDEVAFFIAPRILTGRQSRPVVGGLGSPESLSECLQLHQHRCRRIGDDYLIEGFLTHVHRSH